MSDHTLPKLRIAACRETHADGKQWSFYLINDSAKALQAARLVEIWYEWAERSTKEKVDAHVTDVPPKACALLWRADGDGAEFRQHLILDFVCGDQQGALRFEFPRLYRKRHLPRVKTLGKRGWASDPAWL